jgi:ribosomal protein S18 acetylase RimI-like enzyme
MTAARSPRTRTASRPRRPKAAGRLLLRRVRREALDDIDAIEQASFARDRFPRRNLARLLMRPTAAALLATVGGAPAGYVLLLFRNGATSARLYSLATAPAARGMGVGRALVDAASALALKWGCARLRLEVRRSNVAARRLYETAGFGVIGMKPGYYEDGESALQMEKRLDQRGGGER